MKRSGLRTCLIVMLLLLGTAAAVHADAGTTFYGTTVGQPTFNRPNGLSTLSGRIVRYSVQPFFPNADATCLISSIQEGDFDGYILLYRNVFDPANPLNGLIALDDDGPDFSIGQSRIDPSPLLFNDNYYLVTTAFSVGATGTFSNEVLCNSPATRVVVGDGAFGTGNYDGRIAELLGGRFKVSVTGFDFSSVPFIGRTAPLGSTDSAVFWFFQPANFELLVKIVNGCGFNGRYWVYYAATTNVDFTLSVDDTFDGAPPRTYHNPLGTQFLTSVADTNAFNTCF